jgi:hypothetical protein
MPAKLGVLIIHGVGSQKKDFAEPMKKKLRKGICDHAKIRWQPVYWAPILSRKENNLLRQLFPEGKPPHWFGLRDFVMNYVGDATAYRYIPTSPSQTKKANKTYNDIHKKVHEAIVDLRKNLGSADKPVIVMAHSLGSVIMSDYIWDRQNWDKQKRQDGDPEKKQDEDPYGKTKFERMETLAGLITFGSPIPLFTLAYRPVKSIKFPPKTLPVNLRKKAKWLNFYDHDDVFGWPLKHLSKSYEDAVTDDFPINVGLSPLCHHEYWTDNDFTKPVAEYVSEILKVCP